MLKDQKELLSAFNEHGVEYLVVGGQAVNAYGIPRATKDVDILIRSSVENSRAVYRALASFGAPVRDFSPEDFRDRPDTVIQFGVEPNRIDILQSIGSLEFEPAWQRRVMKQIDETLTVPFLSVEDLIENKLQTGRLQDLADADGLQKILRIR